MPFNVDADLHSARDFVVGLRGERARREMACFWNGGPLTFSHAAQKLPHSKNENQTFVKPQCMF